MKEIEESEVMDRPAPRHIGLQITAALIQDSCEALAGASVKAFEEGTRISLKEGTSLHRYIVAFGGIG